jgi:hypothetical protein
LPLLPGLIFFILGSALLGANHRLVVKVKSMVRNRLDNAFALQITKMKGESL